MGRDESEGLCGAARPHSLPIRTELSGLPELRVPAVRDDPGSISAPDGENYLQLPSGTGEGQYYDFDLTDFCRRFECEMPAVTDVIRLLEQEGSVKFLQQQVSMPARVKFVTGKEALYEFEAGHPDLQSLIHGLLRGYGRDFRSAGYYPATSAGLWDAGCAAETGGRPGPVAGIWDHRLYSIKRYAAAVFFPGPCRRGRVVYRSAALPRKKGSICGSRQGDGQVSPVDPRMPEPLSRQLFRG